MKWFGPRLKIQIGIVLVLGMCVLAVFAPLLAPHDPYDPEPDAAAAPAGLGSEGNAGHTRLGTVQFRP